MIELSEFQKEVVIDAAMARVQEDVNHTVCTSLAKYIMLYEDDVRTTQLEYVFPTLRRARPYGAGKGEAWWRFDEHGQQNRLRVLQRLKEEDLQVS
jgi:hypothetical protein